MGSSLNYVNTVHIGSGADDVAAGTPLTLLEKGQLALVKASTMTVVDVTDAATELTEQDKVYIATGNADVTFKLSTPIEGKNTHKYGGSGFLSRVNQNIQVGKQANGNFVGIAFEDEKEYQLNILIHDDQRPHGQKQTRDQYSYRYGDNATSGEGAFAIASLFGMKYANGTYKTYGERWVALGVVSSLAAGTAETSAASFIFGSKTVKFVGAVVGTGGDYLTVTGTNGNGVSRSHVYLIESVDTVNNIVVLDSPFQLNSEVILAANMFTNDAATQLAAVHAFDIIGLNPMNDWNGIDTDEFVRFSASYYKTTNTDVNGLPTDDDLAPIQVLQPGRNGTGTCNQVYDLEYFAEGYMGVNSRTRWFDNHINPDSRVNFDLRLTNEGYGIVTIVHSAKYLKEFQEFGNAPLSTSICLEVGSPQYTGFVAVLNEYFDTVLGLGPVAL